MKVRPSVKTRCEHCKVIRRAGVGLVGGGLGGPLRVLPQEFAPAEPALETANEDARR
jgi:hypothetical protein